MKPVKSSSRAARGAPKAGGGTGGVSCVLVAVLLVAAFVFGLKVGALFVHAHDQVAPANGAQPEGLGLPGTKNILHTWSLRGAEQPPVTPLATSATAAHGLDVISERPAPQSATAPAAPIAPAATVAHASAALALSPPSASGLPDGAKSLRVDQRAFMEGPTDLDHADVLVSAWIFLDDNPTRDSDMRTVFSNKLPGCETSAGQHGISMFVNAWQSSDHKLWVEYGAKGSGCNKLSSGDVLLHFGRWYHVAAYFGSAEVALFVDGREVARAAATDPHVVQTDNRLLVGHYSGLADRSFALFGNISSLAVVHTTRPSEAMVSALQSAAQARTVDGIRAFYPLGDSTAEEPVAHDIISGNHGRCELPMPGQQMAGVPIAIVDGRTVRTVTDAMRTESDRLGRERREKIKDGMRHAWKGYRDHAWGRDELRPISGTSRDNWGGMGVTLVDSLDTLWLMGLKDEFREALGWVRSSLTFAHAGTVSVFETTIRELGGLLSAYDLSRERVFLDKAKELGDRLMPAFGTGTGIPTSHVNLNSGSPSGGWAGTSAVLSELGSLQLEFRHLSRALDDDRYATASMKAMKRVLANNPANGLYPIRIRIQDGGFADSTVTFGALGDSFFEYLLKLWIQGGKKEAYLREAYDKAMDGAVEHMLLVSSKTGLAFLADWDGSRHNRKMDHLVCFMPGLLTLGAYTSPEGLQSARAQRDLAVARGLMYTCREMYHRTNTGIAPEYVRFPEGGDMDAGYGAEYYILRPETAESLFVMAQLTGEPVYRDWAWEIWEAIDRVLRTPLAYASLHDVSRANSLEDRMESFFLAETMKYLYLAQDPDMPVDLTKSVFNTEAHPLGVFQD